MYGLLRQNLTGVEGSAARGAGWFNWAVVGRTVLLLGLTSLLTDISSEMVSAVLPACTRARPAWYASAPRYLPIVGHATKR
jgi:hypothetical protein